MKRIIISDVDGTLVRGSLVLRHACFLHDEGIIDLADLPSRWLAEQKNESLISPLAEAYREAITGMTKEDVKAREFVQGLVSDPSNFYAALGMLNEHRADGDDVRLISGSPSYLLTPFARAFGFKSKGSLYERDDQGRFTGRVRGMFNAKAKAAYVRSLRLADYAHVTAYGDTMSDKPLFDAAHYSILVDPSEVTLAGVGRVDRVLSA